MLFARRFELTIGSTLPGCSLHISRARFQFHQVYQQNCTRTGIFRLIYVLLAVNTAYTLVASCGMCPDQDELVMLTDPGR
jgi:hypothetical protein